MFFLMVVLAASATMPAHAQSQAAAVTIAARAGFAGSYRAGEWFAVIVDLANDGPDLRGQLEWQLPGQRNEQSFRYAIDLPRGSRKRIQVNAFSRGFARSGQLRLFNGDVVVAEQSVALEPIDTDRFIIGVVSSDPTLLSTLESLQVNGSNGTVVLHLSADDLPDQALALRSLNALFIHDIDTAQLSPAQREAIRLWTVIGGQLVVGGGVHAQQAAAGLSEMLPVEIGGVAEGEIGALLQLGQVPLPSGATRAPLSALRPRPGAVDLTGQAGLIYRSPYGAGSVTASAFDLALLRGWSDEPRAWQPVLAALPLFTPALGSRTNQTSLLQSVLQLPGLGLPSVATLLVFLLSYILVIGPLNYIVLRRFGRLEWAWLSVPIVVALFAGGLYMVGFGLRGSQSQLIQMTVVQGSEGQPRGLATGLIALFSPQRSSYTVGFPSNALIHETRGLDDFPARTEPIAISERGVEMRDLLVDIASVRTLVTETAVDVPVVIESSIQIDSQNTRGEIRNSGATALEDVLVVRGGAFVELGALPVGAARTFDFSGAIRNFPRGVTLPEEGLFNRKILLNGLFSGDATLYSVGTGPLGDTGIYLIGWVDSPSLPVQINGREQPQSGYTLYVIRLRT